MPFKSDKQKRFFQACLDPDFRKKNPDCPPIKTIREYMRKNKTNAKRKKTKSRKGR